MGRPDSGQRGRSVCLGLIALSLFLAIKLAFGTIYFLHLGTDSYERAADVQFFDDVGGRSKWRSCAADADARRQTRPARAELMVREKIDAAFEATASLMAGASGDEIVHRYRRHVAANAKRLGRLNSGRSRALKRTPRRGREFNRR